MHGGFAVVENQIFPGKRQLPHLGFHGGQGADALRPRKAHTAILRKIHGAGIHIGGHILPPGDGLHLLLRLGGVRRRAPQAVFVDQPHKFQFLEQLIQLQPVIGLNNGILRRKIDGRFRADGGKVEGKIGVLLPRLQLFPELGADGWVVQMGVNPVQTAEFRQQLLCGLGADAGHARNIVGGIPHEGFQVDELFRFETVFLPEFFFVKQRRRGLPRLGDHQLDVDISVDQLQGIPVAGDDDTLPVLLRANLAHGADDVISLPALTLIDGNIHRPQNVLHNGHLLRQFLGHGMAGSLVAIVFQVPEGGAVEVEGHAHRLGLLLLLHPFQNVEKAVNGVGIQPVPGGQGLDAEIGAVNDAVAVQNQQLHTFLHFAP